MYIPVRVCIQTGSIKHFVGANQIAGTTLRVGENFTSSVCSYDRAQTLIYCKKKKQKKKRFAAWVFSL
jgi:hypothetical protein